MSLQFFKKTQRLKRRKWIQALFQYGTAYQCRPLVCYWLPWQELTNHQVLITVPKKKIRQAVQRNLIKRRIREAYRKAQHQIAPELLGKALLIGYVYIGKVSYETHYKMIVKAVEEGINNICKKT